MRIFQVWSRESSTLEKPGELMGRTGTGLLLAQTAGLGLTDQ